MKKLQVKFLYDRPNDDLFVSAIINKRVFSRDETVEANIQSMIASKLLSGVENIEKFGKISEIIDITQLGAIGDIIRQVKDAVSNHPEEHRPLDQKAIELYNKIKIIPGEHFAITQHTGPGLYNLADICATILGKIRKGIKDGSELTNFKIIPFSSDSFLKLGLLFTYIVNTSEDPNVEVPYFSLQHFTMGENKPRISRSIYYRLLLDAHDNQDIIVSDANPDFHELYNKISQDVRTWTTEKVKIQDSDGSFNEYNNQYNKMVMVIELRKEKSCEGDTCKQKIQGSNNPAHS